MRRGDKWVDRNAGPVVRPYALTGGRTEPTGGTVLDLIAVIVATTWVKESADLSVTPEHRSIIGLCRTPTTVADVASATALPVGVVRILLADLILQGRITVITNRSAGEQPSTALLKEVLHGLRTL